MALRRPLTRVRRVGTLIASVPPTSSTTRGLALASVDAIPATMRAMVVENGRMVVASVPTPRPRAHEVLVKVHTCGVNRPDILQKSGKYPAPPGSSPYLGLEVSGTVVEAGAGVSRLPAPTGAVESAPVVGRDVCALTNGGGYAEFVTVPAGQVLPLPAQPPDPVRERHMVRAAAIPEAAMTVWNNVFLRGRLGVGSVFLAHGGAGGVGSFAVRMARAAGAVVVTTAATRERGQWCQSLGAHVPIAYEAEDFAAVLKDPGWKARLAECQASLAKETPAIRCPDPAPTGPSGDGVDVILDIVGGAYLPKNVEVLGTEGRLVQIAFQQGSSANVNFMRVMLKRLWITGSTLRSRSDADKAAITQSLLDHAWPFLWSQITDAPSSPAGLRSVPVIAREFPLEAAEEAHAWLDGPEAIGKAVLRV